jgi:hypothetical protein
VAHFPQVAEMLAMRPRRNGAAADDPEYWFEQEVAEIQLQAEPVAAKLARSCARALQPERWWIGSPWKEACLFRR